jgi:L-lactate dehydrogenase complex protein LldG
MNRSHILDAVRAANRGRSASEPAGLRTTPSPDAPSAKLVDELASRLMTCGVIVERVRSPSDVPEAVLRYLTAARLPLSIRHGSDAMIVSLPWDKAAAIERRTGAATPDDQATLSRALSGISETGTLLLGSGADNPVTLAFLPELHMVVLDEAHVVASMESAFDLVQRASQTNAGLPALPRSVNLISGASRTGDIGGRLVMGAHGPRQLVVLLTGGANKNGTLSGAV